MIGSGNLRQRQARPDAGAARRDLLHIFNAQELIYESLTSVAGAVDEIRIYDGRFTDYRCVCSRDHDNSCDSTSVEVDHWVAEYPDAPPTRYFMWPAMPEMEKRSKMMADVPLGDVAFVMDDDELLFGRREPLREFARDKPDWFAYIDFLHRGAAHGSGVPIPLARLFVRTPGLRYERYYHVVDDRGLVVDMREDNRHVPYGRRAYNRVYIHPSTRICELWEGYRGKARDRARTDYNELISKRGWR